MTLDLSLAPRVLFGNESGDAQPQCSMAKLEWSEGLVLYYFDVYRPAQLLQIYYLVKFWGCFSTPKHPFVYGPALPSRAPLAQSASGVRLGTRLQVVVVSSPDAARLGTKLLSESTSGFSGACAVVQCSQFQFTANDLKWVWTSAASSFAPNSTTRSWASVTMTGGHLLLHRWVPLYKI